MFTHSFFVCQKEKVFSHTSFDFYAQPQPPTYALAWERAPHDHLALLSDRINASDSPTSPQIPRNKSPRNRDASFYNFSSVNTGQINKWVIQKLLFSKSMITDGSYRNGGLQGSMKRSQNSGALRHRGKKMRLGFLAGTPLVSPTRQPPEVIGS